MRITLLFKINQRMAGVRVLVRALSLLIFTDLLLETLNPRTLNPKPYTHNCGQVETLWRSLPSLLNIAGLMLLVFFVYAVLGMKLFGRVVLQASLTLNP